MAAVHLREAEGRWWLADGRGDRFVSVGVNHLQSDCWLAPYNRDFMLRRYGADLSTPDNRFNAQGAALGRLIEATGARLRDLGFNTLGIHTGDVPAALFADDFYYCVAVEHAPLGSRYRFGEQTFPDIFSDAFERALEARVRDVCLEHRGNARLIGYAYSDIPRWYFYEGQTLDARPVHPWVEDLCALPDGAPGREACRAVLGSNRPATRAQSDAVLQAVVTRWYALHRRLIRRYDPHRLLLGDKLHSPHRLPAWFLPILRESVDVVFVQWYTPIDRQAATLAALHRATGRPLLNGDSCFSCAKPPRQTRVKGWPVPSQAAVGEAYAAYLEGAMRLPFMLGWHHCGLVEQWDGGKQNDWEINENGLFDPFEAPYVEITTRVRAANRMAAAWHAEGPRPCA